MTTHILTPWKDLLAGSDDTGQVEFVTVAYEKEEVINLIGFQVVDELEPETSMFEGAA